MLKMGREATIFRYSRPAVVLYHNFGRSGVNHWFDRDDHAHGEAAALARLTVVRDMRGLVHGPPDAVSDELPDHREASGLDVRLDRKTEISQPFTGNALRNGLIQGDLGGFHQGQRPGGRRLAYGD